MKKVLIASTVLALIIVAVDCGTSVTTVRATKQTSGFQAPVQENLARGISLYESGDYAGSETSLKQVVQDTPKNWQAHRYLGLARFKLGHYHPACESLLRSLDLAPDDSQIRADLYASLGECWENLKEPGKARLHYHTALNLWPQCTQANEGMARLAPVSGLQSR